MWFGVRKEEYLWVLRIRTGEEKRTFAEFFENFREKRGCGCWKIKRTRAGGGISMPEESKSQDIW
jgi:hypothetical protein